MDRSRTAEQLMTIFEDNNQGLITAQDIRDLIESAFQYGGLKLKPGQTPNPQTIGTDYLTINQYQSTSIPDSEDVVLNISTGKITIKRAGVYAVGMSFSFSGSNNSKWTGSVFRNGEDMEICNFVELLRPAGDVSSVNGFGALIIKDDDVLDYRVKANGNNKQFLLETGGFSVFRIG